MLLILAILRASNVHAHVVSATGLGVTHRLNFELGAADRHTLPLISRAMYFKAAAHWLTLVVMVATSCAYLSTEDESRLRIYARVATMATLRLHAITGVLLHLQPLCSLVCARLELERLPLSCCQCCLLKLWLRGALVITIRSLCLARYKRGKRV